MLSEIKRPRQIKGEPFRRWFSGDDLDLIVWYADNHDIMGFQLCYNIDVDERAITWLKGRGFTHNRVDDGESLVGHHKMTPILVADGTFPRDQVLARFVEAARELDPAVIDLLTERLRAYPTA